jgi:tRNA threonylcarbamoyladenosine biosynthesis protein TsaE
MHVERTPEGLRIEVASEAETDRLGRALAEVVVPNTVIGLVGPLGAGKTRLVRSLSEALGVDPMSVSSPTFVLIHEYEGRLPVYHLDAYRLGGPEPFETLGVAEYWEAGGICLVEWANLVADVLPVSTWWVAIEPTGPVSRKIDIRAPEIARLVDVLQRGAGDF